MKILVIGHNGLLGAWVMKALSPQHEVITASRQEGDIKCDFTQASQTLETLQSVEPDWIINLAAMADVDKCEENPNLAYQANVQLNLNLRTYLEQNSKAKVIAISTDHVYDGPGEKKENDLSIRNVYALTKRAGEIALQGTNSVVLRTNFFGRSLAKKKSFSDWIVDVYRQQQPAQFFNDSIFTPLHGKTLAANIALVIQNPHFGVFNLGSHQGLSKADFAQKLALVLGLKNDKITICPSSEVKTRVRRPLNMSMDSTLFEKTYKVQLPTLENEISICKGEYHV